MLSSDSKPMQRAAEDELPNGFSVTVVQMFSEVSDRQKLFGPRKGKIKNVYKILTSILE
jgi:hypothetical protein